MRGLKEKVAIVTGSASPKGIGFAAARRLAEEGTKVVLTDLDGASVAERAEELRAAGYRAIGLAHDATDEAAWEEVLRATKAEFGALDILVNNAAMIILSPVVDMNFADWQRVIAVNSNIAFLGCRMAAREMQASGGGSIVTVSSTAALVAGETAAAYCASKGAVQMLTKVLAVEMAKKGVRVNSVNPGNTLTGMFIAQAEDVDAAIAETAAAVPMGRLADPSEIASAIAFLASDEASYCTGTALVVDGGWTA